MLAPCELGMIEIGQGQAMKFHLGSALREAEESEGKVLAKHMEHQFRFPTILGRGVEADHLAGSIVFPGLQGRVIPGLGRAVEFLINSGMLDLACRLSAGHGDNPVFREFGSIRHLQTNDGSMVSDGIVQYTHAIPDGISVVVNEQ